MDRHQHIVSGLRIRDLVVMTACFAVAAMHIERGLLIVTIREFMRLRVSLGKVILFTAFEATLRTIPAVLRRSSRW